MPLTVPVPVDVRVFPAVSKIISCPATTVTLSVISSLISVTTAPLFAPAKSIAPCTLSKFVVTPLIVVLATTSLHTAYSLIDWSCVYVASFEYVAVVAVFVVAQPLNKYPSLVGSVIFRLIDSPAVFLLIVINSSSCAPVFLSYSIAYPMSNLFDTLMLTDLFPALSVTSVQM